MSDGIALISFQRGNIPQKRNYNSFNAQRNSERHQRNNCDGIDYTHAYESGGNNCNGIDYNCTYEPEEFYSMEPAFQTPHRMENSQRPVSLFPSTIYGTGNNCDDTDYNHAYESEDSISPEPPRKRQPSPPPIRIRQLPPLPTESPPSYQEMKENKSMEVEYMKPTKKKRSSPTSPQLNHVTTNRPMDTTESMCDNIELQQPVLKTEEDLSSGFGYSSFNGPKSMNQRQTKPRSMHQISQDILEEEDGSNNFSDEDKEDEAMSMNNPSYQEIESETNELDESSNQKKEDEMYDDAQIDTNDASSDSSTNSSSNEEISTEDVKAPSTNKDNKKPSQYYPTFPKSDDGTWKEPAEPIKDLDESQEETHMMELDKSFNAHNDEEKIISASSTEDR